MTLETISQLADACPAGPDQSNKMKAFVRVARKPLVHQPSGGRKYFDSGEYALATQSDGAAPDDALTSGRADAGAIAALTPRWKMAALPSERPRAAGPSRLSVCS